jgi:uridine kinase
MNIVEAFAKFNKQLIIIISGLSGSGKSKIGSYIERDFKIKHINIDDYCKKDYENYVEVLEGVKINDWDHIDAYNWDKINERVNDLKSKGVVISGPYVPTDNLNSKQDFHINIKISKQKLIENRHNFIKENPEKCADLVKFLDTPTELAIINKVVYPHYLEYGQKSKIDKYINASEMEIDEIYDIIADYLFYKINQYLTEYNEKIVKENVAKMEKKQYEADFAGYDLDKNAIYLGKSDKFDLA